MSDQNLDQTTSANNTETKTGFFKTKRRKYIAIGAAVLTAGGVLAGTAFSNSNAYAHMKVYMGEDGGIHKAGFRRHGGFGHFSKMSDEEIDSIVQRMSKHVAIEIDATEEQRVKIASLVSAVAKDMRPVRGKIHAAGMQFRTLLLSDNLDRNAIEAERKKLIDEADKMSQELVETAAAVSEVLTPEQRKLVEKRIEEFRGMRKGWGRH